MDTIYYLFNDYIRNIIKRAKEKSRVEFVGLRIREFDREKLRLENGQFKEFKQKGLLIYFGDNSKEQDEFENAWKNRVAYAPKTLEGISIERFEEEIARQMKERITKEFEGNETLEMFADGL